MAIEDQRIHLNRKRNNQNRLKINLIIDEYDGETLSHDKANEFCCRWIWWGNFYMMKLMQKHVKFILYQMKDNDILLQKGIKKTPK